MEKTELLVKVIGGVTGLAAIQTVPAAAILVGCAFMFGAILWGWGCVLKGYAELERAKKRRK